MTGVSSALDQKHDQVVFDSTQGDELFVQDYARWYGKDYSFKTERDNKITFEDDGLVSISAMNIISIDQKNPISANARLAMFLKENAKRENAHKCSIGKVEPESERKAISVSCEVIKSLDTPPASTTVAERVKSIVAAHEDADKDSLALLEGFKEITSKAIKKQDRVDIDPDKKRKWFNVDICDRVNRVVKPEDWAPFYAADEIAAIRDEC